MQRRGERRTASWVLGLWALGWLLLASHAAAPHVRDGVGGWLHADAQACCAHADEGRPERSTPAGEPRAVHSDAHWHACHVLELGVPGAPPQPTLLLAVAVAPAPRASVAREHDVDEREPRHRLAPKGSPPRAALAAAHV